MATIFNRSSMRYRRQVLRRNMSKEEIILWSRIRRKQVGGYKFRRQYSVGSYVLDFYCPELKLAIEIDGVSHNSSENKRYDQERQNEIEGLGIAFLRFYNADINNNLNKVLEIINKKIKSRNSLC
jgi:very-short-patch-repair endonuclease